MTISTQDVSFAGNGRPLNGYLARPEAPGTYPAVIVIHEAFGLNENIKDVTRRFADQGYTALAVDLFTGQNQVVCMARLFAGLTFNALDHFGIHDLKATLDYFVGQPGVDSAKIGAIGFCLGGSLAIAWACTDARLKVVAPYYGFNPRPIEAVNRMCPVVGSYPEKDPTANSAKKLNAALDATAIKHDIKIYPDARHSFFNDKGGAYNAAAAGDSWDRVLAFFGERIG